MKKYISRNSVWIAILGFLFVGFFRLSITGDLQYYLHKKMFPFVYFATLILGALLCFELWNLKNKERRSFDKGIVLFFIPMCALLIQPTSLQLDGNILQRFHIKEPAFALSIPGVTKEKDYSQMTAEELGLLTEETLFYQSEKKKHSFLSDLDEIYDTQRNDVKEYTLEGFVLKDSNFRDDQIFVARTIITCCVADAMIDGVLCEGEELKEIQNNQWVRVTGIIRRMEKKEEAERLEPSDSHIVLDVERIEVIDPIDPPYIYAY